MKFLIHLTLIPFWLLFNGIHSTLSAQINKKEQHIATDYAYNPYVPIELWTQLKPYFLPVDHPIKKKLDRLFHETHVTLSKETFTTAGFSITRRNRPINAVVTGHKQLKGYLVKVYLDSQLALPEWFMWLKRIKGAELIQACLNKHGYTQFIVPFYNLWTNIPLVNSCFKDS